MREDNKLKGALQKYKRAIELYPENFQANKEMKEIEAIEEKRAYIKKIEIKNFKVGKGRRFGIGSPEPAVVGKIINNGDRSLKKIQITIYFLGRKGSPIAEAEYHPVLVTEFSFGGNNTPLKPGYVRDFGYVVGDEAPSD